MQLAKKNDSVDVLMPRFSKYPRSGKVWHSPPLYFREIYKMCLAVCHNGLEEGASTHVSIILVLYRDGHVQEQQQPLKERQGSSKCVLGKFRQGNLNIILCQNRPPSRYGAMTELSEQPTFHTHEYIDSRLVNDCLTFNIVYADEYIL